MKDRISLVISESHITKTKFAEMLSVSTAFVSQMCSGASAPSERTINDICRLFGISKRWLQTGEGEMYEPKTREEEVAELVGRALSGSNEFKMSVVKMICSRTEKELETLEKALREIYESL